MRKAELKILEKAFEREINAHKCAEPDAAMLLQTKSKYAEKLANEGYLQKVTVKLGGRFPVRCEGYVLTHAGRLAYCATCEGETV